MWVVLGDLDDIKKTPDPFFPPLLYFKLTLTLLFLHTPTPLLHIFTMSKSSTCHQPLPLTHGNNIDQQEFKKRHAFIGE